MLDKSFPRFLILLLSLWLGGQLVLAGLVLPVLFAKLPSLQAGDVASLVLHQWAKVTLIFLSVAILWQFLRQQTAGVGITFILLFLELVIFFYIMPEMASIKVSALTVNPEGITALAMDDPMRRQFTVLHKASSAIHVVQTLLGLILYMKWVRPVRIGEGRRIFGNRS